MMKKMNGMKLLIGTAVMSLGILCGSGSLGSVMAEEVPAVTEAPKHMAPEAYTRSYEDPDVVYTADIDEL